MSVSALGEGFFDASGAGGSFTVQSLVLDKAPHLSGVYSLNAGVSEGYTVLEHSQMVVERALNYRVEIESRLPQFLSFERFLLFLALHDAGKGVGHQEVPREFRTPLSMKRAETDATILLMEMNQKVLQLLDHELTLFRAMVENDSVGLYLKGAIHFMGSLEWLCQGAAKADVMLADFITLMDLYHNCDAGSYPALSSELFDRFMRKTEGKNYMAYLREFAISAERGQNLCCIVPGLGKEGALEILERGSDDLLRFATALNYQIPYSRKNPIITAKLINNYQCLFQTAGIHSLFEGVDSLDDHQLLKRYRDDVAQLNDNGLSVLARVVCGLRRNFIVRYKREEYGLTFVSQARWLHGTSGIVFEGLPASGEALVCTGMLKRSSLWPISGEQDRGCGDKGVNLHNLSGVSLKEVPLAVEYATFRQPPIDLEESKEALVDFIEWDFTSLEGELIEMIAARGTKFDLNVCDRSIYRDVAIVQQYDSTFFQEYHDAMVEAISKKLEWLGGVVESCLEGATEINRKVAYERHLANGAKRSKILEIESTIRKCNQEINRYRRDVELAVAKLESLDGDSLEVEKSFIKFQQAEIRSRMGLIRECEEDLEKVRAQPPPPFKEPESFGFPSTPSLFSLRDHFVEELRALQQMLEKGSTMQSRQPTFEKVGVVFSSFTSSGSLLLNSNCNEKIVGHPMVMGRDIQAAFVTKVTPKLDEKLELMGLKVFPMEVLYEAQQREQEMRLYDIFEGAPL